MRVLVLTNHFAAFYGSEIVALEVARWFCDRGDDVTLGANHIGNPIRAHAEGVRLMSEIETLKLSNFDLVWCQHDLLTLLPASAFEHAAREVMPHVALVSLSPYEPYEHIDALLARALSADVVVNSHETALEIARRSHGRLASSRMRIFHNAAPKAFWRQSRSRGAPFTLKSVTLISNHAPPELLEALALLERKGIHTHHIGSGRDYRLVRPDDIATPDAIISIGKSVPYAIAQCKPVYVYDHFGGDGWLTLSNLPLNMAHNFSGRPTRRLLNAETIAHELMSGYAEAATEMDDLWTLFDLKLFSLDHHLAGLRDRALRRAGRWRALNLRRHLAEPRFRAQLETLRAKSTTMKRSYNQIMDLAR